MSLVYNDDERLLLDAARGFLAEHASVTALRRLRDERDAQGFPSALWTRMVEMGWSGILIPEEFGGLQFGHVGAGMLCEQSGHVLAASPLFATAILAATLIRQAGSDAQKAALLPAIAEGRQLLALAVDETARHDPLAIRTRAEAVTGGYRLNGCKTMVVDGHVADTLIVAARSAGEAGERNGISLFLVQRDCAGLGIERTIMVDSRNAAELRLDDVEVPADALLGALHEGWAALEHTLDVGRICIAAELLGIADEVFARTVEYLKQRKQFGELIGSFQGLQHRAAHLFCEIELSRSAILRALRAIDEQSPQLPLLASLAKAKTATIATQAVNEALQMHGGIGMTDEFEIGFFMKRAVVLRHLFGDSHYHSDRFAALSGY